MLVYGRILDALFVRYPMLSYIKLLKEHEKKMEDGGTRWRIGAQDEG